MAHSHDTHVAHGHNEGAILGMASGLVFILAAVVLAAVIAGIVLLVAQPWDNDSGGSTVPNVPGIEEPGGGGTGGAGTDGTGQ